MTRNQIELRSVKETERHNRATEQLEQEKNRYTEEHYIRSDAAAMSQAGAAWANVEVNRINSQTRLAELGELQRYHDLQYELQDRAMSVQEGELSLAKEKWGTQSRVAVTEVQQTYQKLDIEREKNALEQRRIDVDIQKFNATMDYNIWKTEYEDTTRTGTAILNFLGRLRVY